VSQIFLMITPLGGISARFQRYSSLIPSGVVLFPSEEDVFPSGITIIPSAGALFPSGDYLTASNTPLGICYFEKVSLIP